jgi:hypothetical protein
VLNYFSFPFFNPLFSFLFFDNVIIYFLFQHTHLFYVRLLYYVLCLLICLFPLFSFLFFTNVILLFNAHLYYVKSLFFHQTQNQLCNCNHQMVHFVKVVPKLFASFLLVCHHAIKYLSQTNILALLHDYAHDMHHKFISIRCEGKMLN